MGIIVPSSTPITLAADEVSGEYYQKFMVTDETGSTYMDSNPLPVSIVVSGYSATALTYQGSYTPIGGVYINDLTGTDFTEMVDGETATFRMNNRRALMTASDGQVTTLVEAQPNNYHDVVVASGASFDGITVPAYSDFFAYVGDQITRYVYVPLSKSGWKRLNLFIKHDLTQDSDSTPAPVGINLYADFGQFTNDFPIITDTISGVVGALASRAYTCVAPTISGNAATYVAEFNSPLAGVIISIVNSEPVSGNVEIYASKSA
jgi:hypothetical protein